MRILSWREKSKKAADIFITLAFLTTQMFGVGLVLASQQVAAAPVCVSDTAGANDEPGQKDLTRLCLDNANLPTSVQATWNWDESGTNGQNSMDGCALFDTDGDGNVNYSACVTTNGDPADFTSLTLYSCGDAKIDRCTSAVTTLTPPYASTCTVDQANSDPFNGSGNNKGDDYPVDTVATCTIKLSDFGNNTSISLVDVCSYPSQQPNSDPSDCVITRDSAGKVQVIKDIVPNSDSGKFNLTIDGPGTTDTTTVSNVGDNGTTGEVVVGTGSVVVSETAGTSTVLSEYTTSIVCKDLNGTGAIVAQASPSTTPTRQLTFTLADQADVVCTITNTKQQGTLTLIKTVTNDNGGALSSSNFPLTIDGNATTSGQAVTVAPGNHTINETQQTGYAFESITGTGCPATLGGTVAVANGDNITCTIKNNDLPGTLIVNKSLTNNNGGTKQVQDFSYKVNNGTSVAFENDGSNSQTVNAGTYSVAEVADSAYATTYTNSLNANTNCANLVIPNGGTATCTITNNDVQPQLTVIKHVVNQYGGTATSSNFTMNVAGTNVSSASFPGVDTTGTTVTLDAGTYKVTESGPMGYTPSFSADCDSAITAGQTKTCTVTNTQQPGAISGFKYEVNADSSQVKALGGWVIYIDANSNNMYDPGEAQTTTAADGSYSFTNLFTNVVYNVKEVLQAGWTQIFGASNPVSVSSGQTTTTGTNFGNFDNASISGVKFDDVNGNGVKDAGEASLAGWTIQLKNSSAVVVNSTVTTVGGYGFNDVAPGTYTVCEVGQSGWTQTYPVSSGCHTVVINLSNETNSDINFGNFQSGTVSGYKWNDVNGNGTYDNEPKLNGWTIFIDGNNNSTLDQGEASTTTSGQGAYSFTNLVAGTYKICEVQQSGWTVTHPATVCQTVTIDVSGETETASFGNQGRGSIQVVKNVDTDGDGDIDIMGATDWTWDINGSGNYATSSTQQVAAGTYTVSEDHKTNYHVTASNCTEQTGSTLSESQSVTVGPGDAIVCTFTNTRDTGTFTIVKEVTNNNGGTLGANDFGLTIDGQAATSGQAVTLTTGTHSFNETQQTGYAFEKITGAGCPASLGGNVTVVSNQNVTCTITNNDIAPQLTVIKKVNNSGTNLTKGSADFTMNITGTNVSDDSFAGADTPGTTVTLNAGSYSVGENADSNYIASYSADCTGSIAIGGTKTCTVTNTAILKPLINVVKSGASQAHEGDVVTYTFTVTNPGNAPLSGLTVNDNIAGAGVYQSGDTNTNSKLDPGESWIYTKTYTIPTPQVANVDNTVTACGNDAANTNVCDTDTHTLDVLHPSITVVKSGPLYGYEGQLIGYTFVVTNTGDTSLSNVGISDDIADGEDCANTSLNPGEFTNCTAHYLIPIPTTANVTNHVTASGTDPLQKTVTANDEHTLDVIHPAIQVVKSGPATAHEGDVVTYTFTVTNKGDIPLSMVTVSDNVAGNAIYQSGDTNTNSKLDLTETWIFTKNYTIPAAQTADVLNTATACGYDPIQAQVVREAVATCDTDTHTLDVLHPSLNVVKSGPDTAYEGNTVTYTFTVTNTGDTPLSVQTVNDNVAGAGVYQSGDTNTNSKLDLTETWVYTRQYTIPAPSGDITNTVTVCVKDPLDLQKCDTDTHVTHVYHPMIKVTKYVNPSADNGTFNLQIDSLTKATGGNGTTTGNVLVAQGTHVVGETGANGTDLSDYDTSIQCWVGEAYVGIPAGTTLHNVTVTGDQHAYCNIYNTRHAHLTVVKNAVPNDEQWFDFTLDRENQCEQLSRVSDFVDGNLLNECGTTNVDEFQLRDHTDPAETTTTYSLSAGNYTLEELEAQGWDLTGVNCGELNFENGGRLSLDAGQNVTCTFTNTKRSSLTIVKDAKPNSLQMFNFTSDVDGSESFSLMDDGTNNANSKTMANLLPGTYTVTEGSLDNWSLDGVACGEGVTMKLDGHMLTVTLAPGATVTCTFTNNQAEVLGAVTTPLVNTGESIWTNLAVGFTALMLAIGLALGSRRQQNAR